VEASQIGLANVTIGRNLQTPMNGALAGPAPAGGLPVTITSLNPGALLISASATMEGQASVEIPVVAGSTFVQFHLQALQDTGTVEFTASAPGYATATATVTLSPSGFVTFNGDFTTNSFALNTTLTILGAVLSPGTLTYAGSQPVRGGLTVNVPVTSSNPAVGTITTSPVVFTGGMSSQSTSFDPAGSGTTAIEVGTPPGFDTPSQFRQITSTVTAPGITFSNVNVGRDLQLPLAVFLDSAPPAPVDVTVRSDGAGVVTVTDVGTHGRSHGLYDPDGRGRGPSVGLCPERRQLHRKHVRAEQIDSTAVGHAES
jgi:hypothetical protein